MHFHVRVKSTSLFEEFELCLCTFAFYGRVTDNFARHPSLERGEKKTRPEKIRKKLKRIIIGNTIWACRIICLPFMD